MKVDINTKKVSDLIAVLILLAMFIAISVVVYGMFNSVIW